ERNLRDSFPLAPRDPIKDELLSVVTLNLHIDLYIEIALGPEIIEQILPAVLERFGRHAVLLIHGQNAAAPRSRKTRALKVDVDLRTGLDTEGDVGAICLGIVIGVGQPYPGAQILTADETRFERPRRVLKRSEGISPARSDCSHS